MRLPVLILLGVMFLINAPVDWWIYLLLRRGLRRKRWAQIHVWISVALAIGLVVFICIPRRNGSNAQLLSIMWALYAYFSIYIPKYLFTIFSLLGRIPCLWKGKPWGALTWVGGLVAVVTFVLMWWGALINRFNIDVVPVDIEIQNLPPSFEGYRIAQISDLHVGTFGDDTTFVARLVDRVNSLGADMIVFTGDIVNRQSSELPPFMKPLSRLSSPAGVYACLGNHDYGDYMDWPSQQAQWADTAALHHMIAQMGWRLLKNEYTIIHRAPGDSLALLGIENMGDPPFKQYGSLYDTGYPNRQDSVVKILLSHNPAQWMMQIENNNNNVDLTLAGHTHAMQMSAGHWSPAVLRYKYWGGLYADSLGHQLYVNRGAGTVGLPYRIGATPEITLITLHNKKKP
ncbi:MAG: metallophosphoesterase [Bacteroidales bacterium]|nr:metallophosphoesterase [Bacteroidales bacterium]